MRRRHIILLLLCAITAPPVNAGTVIKGTRFGAFILEEETRTRDPGEPEIMHVATEWTKLRLIWRSSDKAIDTGLEDDGRFLDAKTSHKDRCLVIDTYLQYSTSGNQSNLWSAMQQSIGRLAKNCRTFSPSAARIYFASFASTADDFVPAIAALQKRAAVLFPFSRMKRCALPLVPKGLLILDDPNAGLPCLWPRGP